MNTLKTIFGHKATKSMFNIIIIAYCAMVVISSFATVILNG